jgi:hypothetical protein
MAEVKLEVNEGEIPLNEIMEAMLKNIVMGYLKSIKGVPEDIKSLHITINP